MYKPLIILIVLTLTGCSSVTHIQESFSADDYDFRSLHNSKIKFAGTEKIYLNEFVKTFNDEYSDTNKLNNKLFDLFSNEFKYQMPGVNLSHLESKVPEILQRDISFKNNNQDEISSFFDSLESDYLIFLDSIEISSEDENSQYYNAATNTVSGSSSEDCVASIVVECWDVNKKIRVLKLKGIGRDTVSFFSYLSSLNDAMRKAVAHSVEYIKNKVRCNQ